MNQKTPSVGVTPPGAAADEPGWHWITAPGLGTRPRFWIGGGIDGTWDVRDGKVGLTPKEAAEEGWEYRIPCPMPAELASS